MEQQTLRMVIPAFLCPSGFFSVGSLLLPLWYVFAHVVLGPYDLLDKGPQTIEAPHYRKQFLYVYSRSITILNRWNFVAGPCAGALVLFPHLLVGSLINSHVCFFILEHCSIFEVFGFPFSWTGGGAYCNGQKIHVSQTDKVACFLF